MITLLTNATTNGNSSTFDWPGGLGLLAGSGTFKGGTLLLQFSPDEGTTWLSSEGSMTASGADTYQLPPCQIRANLASMTEAGTVSAWMARVLPDGR